MHPYAIDSRERITIVPFLALFAFGSSYALQSALARLELEIPWYCETPSFLTIFTLSHLFFDSWVWRLGILRRLRIVRTPDLNGTWEAQGISSHNHTEFTAKVMIRQTWSSILVILETEFSRSHSLVASISISEVEPMLSYEYLNEPKVSPNRPATLHPHRGTCILSLKSKDYMEGGYYTGQDRRNYGSLSLRRSCHAR